MSKGAGEQTTTTQVDPETQRRQKEIWDRARNVSNQGYTPYNGQLVAGANPLSQQAVGGMQQAQGQLGNAYQSSMNANGQAQQTNQNLNGMTAGFMQQNGQMNNLAGGFDAQGQQMNQWAGGADQRAAQMGQFGQQFNNYANTGQTGAMALGGDAGATQQMMNPYQSQVLGAVSADYARQRGQASTQSKQAAAQAGAFGGSRHGVMEGARLGELDQGQMATMANLRQTGFNDAMGRANQAANLGFGAGQMSLQGQQQGLAERGMGMQARQLGQGFNQIGMDARGLGAQYGQMGMGAQGLGIQAQNLGLGAVGQAGQMAQAGAGVSGQLAGMGDYYRQIQQQGLDSQYGQFQNKQNWDARQLGILQSGLVGPSGGTESTPLYRNAGAGALGGAAQGAAIGSIIPGFGTAAGGIIGGALGLFG